ncbi:cation:proton antiporter [Candidatus Nitrosotalea okcheonensis]|uniref:Transporter, CPA2 family n=1 Tax=Candidatus Nitrosotalea okcheonensis TaxID=1903276 RepID=A0A2H1FEM3_9ARCH|nr:cation:proton antiporter [Candidatus Nitrosotalea okcheonensis]SMH71210.1 Transporter, CPA2 family [Candidatus Nitrosotalea okcheonensis]
MTLQDLIIYAKSATETTNFAESVNKTLHSNIITTEITRINHDLAQTVFHGTNLASAQVILLAVGVIIFVGVAGEAFFRKTGIPEVLFLTVVGFVLGPIFGIVDSSTIIRIIPYFSSLALIIIMFDGGLNLDIKTVIRTAHYSLLVAILSFLATLAIVSSLAVYVFDWQWISAILLGSILGGISPIVVFAIVKRVQITEDTKSILILESAMTDIMATIGAFLLFDIIASGHFSISLLGLDFGREVVVGMGLGFGVGIPWLYGFSKITNIKHAYMLTLAILFVLFFTAKSLGESGALTALIFGLVLGNRKTLSRYLKFNMPEVSMEDTFHDEVTFLVRSFFFVFVGLIAEFGQLRYVIVGVIIAIALYLSRKVITKALFTRFPEFDKKVIRSMIPRGLAAAVLSTFALTFGVPHAKVYTEITFIIIISTVIITTIDIGKIQKKQGQTKSCNK